MAHRFRLEFLLRLYGALERREELNLASVGRELAQARQQLEAHARWCRELREHMSTSLAAGLPGAELQFQLLVCRSADAGRGKRQLAVDEVMVRHQAQRERLLAARRRRESLELLRRKEGDAARLEDGRREQALLDELFLMRRQRDHE